MTGEAPAGPLGTVGSPGGASITTRLRRAKFTAESVLGTGTWPYRWLMALRPRARSLLAGSGTEIVIEGYPRSGNTFAVVAFRLAQGRDVSIARHLHAPAQALWGIRHGVPTLVLIRDPGDAALSLVIREPWLTLAAALAQYVRFYGTLLPHREDLVIGPFPEVTSDFGGVIDRINARWGTSFVRFRHDEANVRRCFQEIERMDMEDTGRARVGEATVARPSTQRSQEKEALRAALEQPSLAPLLQRARDLHGRFLS